jgi:predicted enzyme related to lactoylglutathione lyase
VTDAASPRIGLVLDCADPHRLAVFWAEALGYANVGSAGAYVALYPRHGTGPKLLLQHVAEPKTSKNRMHVDIEAPDIHREADRLTALGARRVDDGPCAEHGSTWILMVDPEGNEFCVCDHGTSTGSSADSVVGPVVRPSGSWRSG